MKKITLLLAFSLLSVSLYKAQELKRTIAEPTNAPTIFKENLPKISKELEQKTGYSMSQLKLVKTLPEWHRYFGHKNEEYGYKWPEEMISNYWEYHTPKDANGVFKTISVFIVYTRLNCDAYPCMLTNTYKLDNISTSSADEAGQIKINETEMLKIALEHLKSGKANAFANIVQIDKIETYHPTDISYNKKTLKYSLYGELGIYNYDKTTLLSTQSGAFSFLLHVTNTNKKWEVDSLQLTDYLYSYKDISVPYKIGSQNEYYQNYEKAGFEAIYQTNKKTAKPTGIDEKAITQTNEFYALLKSKGAKITKTDLTPYLSSAVNYEIYPAKNEIDQKFILLKTTSTIYLIKEFTINEGSIVLDEITLSNGKKELLPKAVIYSNVTLSQYKTKKGVPLPKAENEINTEVAIQWIYINNQWFLLNNAAFFFEN